MLTLIFTPKFKEVDSVLNSISRSPNKKWLVLLSIGFGIVTNGIDNSSLNLALPILSNIFDVGADIILWLISAFMLVAVGLALTWGNFGDTFGRKRIYVSGFLLFALGLLVLTFSTSVTHLIIGRIIQALGQSMTVTNGFAIAVAMFPDRQRGLVIGLVGASVGVGLSLGPIFGAAILDNFEWRALFWTRIPLSILAMITAAIIIPKDLNRSREKKNFDYIGAVLLFISLTSFLVFINRLPVEPLTNQLMLVLLVTFLISGTTFIINEIKSQSPVLEFKLFKNRFLAVSLLVHFLHFLGYMFIIFLIPFFLLHGKNMSTTEMGVLLAAIQVVRLFIAPAAGVWTDKIGARRMATFGLFITTTGFFLMSQLDPTSSFQFIAMSLIITGIGASIFDPSNEHAVLSSIPSEKLASGTALTTTARQVGFSISTTIAGTMYAYRLGHYESFLTDSTLAVTGAYQEVLYLGLAIMLVATVLSYARGTEQKSFWSDQKSKIV
tara:strand:+ start:2506 stop:3990 length:1485 start_codon:yes stop_codon:yes gene_type:complete